MRGVKTSIANSFIVAPLLLLSCFVSFVVERVEATATEAATPQPEHEASCPNQDTGDDDAAAEEFLALWEKSDRSHPVYESLVDLSAISAALHCDDDTGEDPRFPTDANYALMIEAYVHASKLNPNPRGRPPTATEYNPEAFFVPVEVRASSEMGRGVFSLGDVAKGTMVNRPSNAMEFYNRETIRDYIVYLLRKRSPQLICDSFEWFYATKASSEPNDYIICLDADDASMINSAHDSLWDESQDDDDGFSGKSTSDGRIMVEEDGVLYEAVIDSDGRIMVEQDGVLYEFQVDGDDDGHQGDAEVQNKQGIPTAAEMHNTNIGQHIVVQANNNVRTLYGCQEPPVYALRDIKAGEELRMSYGDFSEPEGFWFLGVEYPQ